MGMSKPIAEKEKTVGDQKMIKTTWNAIKITVQSKKNLVILLIVTSIVLLLSILVPTILTPGNTLEFQLSLFNLESTLVLLVFSFLVGLAFSVHFYANELAKRSQVAVVGEKVSLGVFGTFSALLATPLCASCFISLFSFIGLGSGIALSILTYKTEIQLASLVLISASIYWSGKRINKNCEFCKK